MSESVMPWKVLIATVPAIMVWQYYDVKEDIAHIEGAQMALERVFVDSQERALGGIPRGPVPEIEAPRETPQAQPREIKQVPETRNLKIVRTNQRVEHVKLDVFCLAKNIFHEAGVEDRLGKYAVAQVTLNRMANPKYPTTVCDVVMDPYQFSWANDRRIRWTRPRGATWNESLKIAEDVLIKGYRVKGLERANYYHADYVRPNWKNPQAKIAQVGTHIFYSSAL